MRIRSTIKSLCKPLEIEAPAIEPRLKRIEGVRAVLFDIYGTLLISGSGDVGTAMQQTSDAAFEKALRVAGIAIRGNDVGPCGVDMFWSAIQRSHASAKKEGRDHPEVDVREIWQEVLEDLKAEGDIEYSDRRGLKEEVGIQYECRVNPVWPMPGASDCLKSLSASGRKLGIVSNAQYYTPVILDALLDGFPVGVAFDRRLMEWSYMILEAKPSPAIFEKPLRNLKEIYGIAPQECVYVGNDMLKDVRTAQQLGLRTILFAGDKRSLRLHEEDPLCSKTVPDAIATDLQQIGSILI